MTANVRNIICHVLAIEYSGAIVFEALNEFIHDCETLNLDYASPPKGVFFESEKEMVNYFIENEKPQTFYWKEMNSSPHNFMFGADITSDDKIIFSLTLDGTQKKADQCLSRLKAYFNSDVGVISYGTPAEYEGGLDFENRYRSQTA